MDRSRPHPPRFRWLIRLSIAVAAVLPAVAGLRAYWGHVMHRQLEAAAAEVRAAGEPIDFEGMLREPVPDADNAAHHYRQAAAAWPRVDDPTTGTSRLIIDTDWHRDPGQHDDPIADNAAYLDGLDAALALLREAATAPDVDWGVRIGSSALTVYLPHLAESRGYTRLIDDAAQRAHDAGRHDLALELVEHLLALADAVEAPPQTLIIRLVGISIRATAVRRLERLTPTLQLGDAPGAASPEHVDRLIAHLLDEDAWRAGFRAGYVGERWANHDTVMAIYDGRASWSYVLGGSSGGASDVAWLRNLFIGPLIMREATATLRWHKAHLGAIEVGHTRSQYTEHMATHAPFDVDDLDRQPWRHPLLGLLLPALDSAVNTDFRSRTNQLMAATALAIRRFELDHGHRPAALDELIPAYLPHGPRDPLAAGDEPIRYRPGGALVRINPDAWSPDPVNESDLPRPAILYSVGTNQVDHGGLLTFDGDGKIDESLRYREGDQYFMLDPWPDPRREPSP